MRVGLSLIGAALLIGTVSASAAAPAPPAAAVAYRLTADLSPSSVVPPVARTGAGGRFEGLLVRTAPGMAVPTSGSLPAGCTVVEPPPHSTAPTRIACDGGRLAVPLSKTTGVRWLLAWRLSVIGLTGEVKVARVHKAPRGKNGPALLTLCRRCPALASGTVFVSSKRASGLVNGADYVVVGARKHPRGEVRGQVLRTSLRVRATLEAPTHTPKVDTKWTYTVRATDLREKPVKARLTVQVVDPVGGVHPVEFGDSQRSVVDHEFTGTFRDYVIWPSESAIPGIRLVFRCTVVADGSRIRLTYPVAPRA
jgi:hypothetical protein